MNRKKKKKKKKKKNDDFKTDTLTGASETNHRTNVMSITKI